jgi:O-methyltransferase involved in polyketide biosynthesis
MPTQDQLKEQTVQSTMLLALYGRAKASRAFAGIMRDDEAIRIVEDMDYDFALIDRTYGTEYACLCTLMRAKRLDERCLAYIRAHPSGTVVNLGAGLDTTFSRVDNGSIRWYNVDLPDSMAFRQRFIPPAQRCTDIAKSMFDYSWLDEATAADSTVGTRSADSADGSVFVLASGLFYYFEEKEVRELVGKIVDRFATGEICFDAQNTIAVSISNRMVRKAGNKGSEMKFWVNDPSQLMRWSPKIRKVEAIKFFADARKRRGEHYKLSTRFNMWGYDALKMGSLISLQW